MKIKKTFSISILVVLTISMAFSGINPKSNTMEISDEPKSAAKPPSTILDINDVLYYNVAEEGYDEMDERYYDDSFVIRLVVNETDTDYIKYMPYFYEEDGGNWDWVEDPPEGDDPHLYDDYTYGVYNHSWSINTTITDISVVNATEDIQGKFATDMNSSAVIATFSVATDDYHNVTLECNKDDDPLQPVFVQWIANKTTGLCLSYTEMGIDENNITAELCGYEIAALSEPLEAPTSFGFAIGDWIDYFIPEHYKDGEEPASSGDACYYDWLERGNNDWTTAFNLNSEFDVPGHWWDLSLYDNFDYYSFHAESGDIISVDGWCEDGADIVLESIDNGDGSVIEYDSENGDTDGHVHLDWTAAYTGEYIIGFTSESGPFCDWYDFQISINSNYGPDYHPDEYHDDDHGPESMFIHQTIEFLYTNPDGDEVLVVKSEGHKDADMLDDPLFVDYREQGRIDPSEINKIEGPYFHKDLDMTSTAFQTLMEEMFFEQDGVLNPTFTSGGNWVEVIGETGDGADFYFFAERFPNQNYGTIQYFEMSIYNNTDCYFMEKDKNIAIKSSISGLINDTVPELGVAVGTTWTYLAQESGEEKQWGTPNDYEWNYENVHYVTITVTHVFHANRTVVAVIGEMHHWSNEQNYPDHKEFMSLLVWDTEDPLSFFNMGGHGYMEDGPPFLLPAGVDWSSYENEFTSMMESMMGDDLIKINIDTNSIRIAWENEYSDEGSEGRNQGKVFLDLNSDGIVIHIAQEEEDHYSYDTGNHWEGYEHRGKLEGFAIEISTGCSKATASDVTEVNSGDVFVWENQRYRPAGTYGTEDLGEEPENYVHLRNTILSVEETCGEFIVFLGSIEERRWDETDYSGKTWTVWDESSGDYVDIGVNSWLIGSIQDGNIWSWMNSQYFDIGITDFAPLETDLIELLNFAFELPDGVEITSSDITISGLTFEILLSFEENPGEGDIDHIMRMAVNNKGIMQEMFMGTQYSNGTWRDWEYTVLIDAPEGYDVGGVFNDLPVENPHDLEGGDPSPFDIPGYSTTIVMIVSIFAIFSLIALISNRRRY